jgi:hypothetical protein
MAGEGRRLAVKAGLAVLAAAASMITAVGGVQADGGQLAITVKVGYHNTVKQGQWMPVVIDVTNNGPALDGTLEIQAGSAQGGPNGPPTGIATYHWPLSLGAGATKHIRTYVFQDQFSGTSMTTQVVDHGHLIASQSVSAANTSGVLIGVLSDRPGTLDTMSSVHLGTFTPAVTHITADELPDTALMLRAFDLLAIDDFATDTLTASQRAAIGDYVMNGGALVLGTGGSWRKTLGGLPASVVPMQVTGATTLVATKAFGGISGLEVATGSPSGGNVWLAEGNQPLLIEKLMGAGAVTMATFDWNQDMVAGWSGTPTILRQVFVRSTFGIGSSPSFGFSKMAYIASVSQKGASFMQSLSNAPALDLPQWWVIGALVLVYVLLVGPINYVVLRAINRRALAWITVPVISIGASGAAYGASVLTKGRSVQATQVAIVHVEQGWDRAYQETYTGILTPTRGDYDVGITGGRVVISPIPNYSPTGLVQNMIRVDPSANSISMPGMTAFTLRSYASEGIAGAPPLVAQAGLVSGNLIGTITNQSTIRFTDAVIIAGNAYQKLPALAPGASVKFSLTPQAASMFGGPQPWTQIYSNYMYGGMMAPGPMSDEQRDNQTKATVLQTLPFNGTKGYDRASRPTIVAWTKQPLQDITVNGSHPRVYSESAVVLTLPVAQVGAGALPSGVVTARAVDLQGEFQPGGMPGMVMLQKGSVTFAFTPALGPGMHLSHASLLSSGPPVKGGFGGPGSTVAPIKALVWDWSQSAWVDVTYSDSANTSVPDSAVNPSTGEIRLKLASDGFFNSGLLSLTADVT